MTLLRKLPVLGLVTSRRGREAFWALSDQTLSSISNFALTLLAARSLPVAEFGAFALAFAAYLILVGVSRALSSDALTARYTTANEATWRAALAESTGSAVVVGLAGGLAVASVALLLSGPASHALLGIAPFLPGLLLQDAWRFGFFAASRGRSAALNDLVWVTVLIVVLIVLHRGGDPSLMTFAGSWGVSGSAAGLFGIVQSRVRPKPAQATSWWDKNRDVVPRYAGEFIATFGAGQVALYAIGAFAGLTAVGALRSAQVLLGPLNIIFMGVALFAVPEAVRRTAESHAGLRRLCNLLAILLAITPLLWLAVLVVMPDRLGQALLQAAWHPARELLPAAALALAGTGLLTGPLFGLRARIDVGRSTRARFIYAVLVPLAAATGAFVAGVEGGAWGIAAATWMSAAVWWAAFNASISSGPSTEHISYNSRS